MCYEGNSRYERRLGLCRLVCPSRTNERGGKRDCVKGRGRRRGARERACNGAATMTQPSTFQVDTQRRRFGCRESDFALQRRRRKNSSCMRVDVLVMAGRKEML
jgi:hypothetical protein